MTKNPSRRLGCLKSQGMENEIFVHAFFHEKIDWEALEQRRVIPPFRPKIVSLYMTVIILGRLGHLGFANRCFVICCFNGLSSLMSNRHVRCLESSRCIVTTETCRGCSGRVWCLEHIFHVWIDGSVMVAMTVMFLVISGKYGEVVMLLLLNI